MTWILLMEAEDKLEPVEMWIFRRLMKIPLTEKISNVDVLRRISNERILIKTIRKRQMTFLVVVESKRVRVKQIKYPYTYFTQ